jgi:ABC-type transport system involved in multi-copper enzyme maturation permease subunit
MPATPILARELLTASRRRQTYRERCVLAALVLLAMSGFYAASRFWHGGQLSVHELAGFAQSAFNALMLLQFVLTGWLVPVFVAGVIAGERERRTLGDLLTTRLSSAEIVLGKLAAGLMQYFACLATGFPIVCLLPLLGGVDPTVIVLAYAGTISTALFLTGLSVLVSIHAPRGGQAVRETIGLEVIWLALPMAGLLVPRTWPGLWPWVQPVHEWLMASTPTGVWLGPGITASGTTFFEAVAWMIGLQLSAGILMIGLAVVRMRAASRIRGGDGDTRTRTRRWPVLRRWLIPRPTCGESPVLWKEFHTARPAGFARLVGVVVFLIGIAVIAYGCFDLGKPAALEWYARTGPAALEWYARTGPGAPDWNRFRFNNYLRFVNSLVELFVLIFIAGAAAEAVAAERARGTWESLLTTQLEGREILLDKMRGARSKGRWGILLLVGLWSAGLLTGSLHPLGVAAALAFLIVSTWFVAALGVYASILARDVTQATRAVIATVVLLGSTFLVCLMPSRMTSISLGSGSMPFVNWLSLVSYRDLREAVGQGTFNQLTSASIFTDEGPVHVLATCLIGTFSYAAAAAWLGGRALAGFERIAGRAHRGSFGEQPDLPGRRARPMSWAVLVVPALLTALAGGYLARHWQEERALRNALADLDRHSPGWRLEDVESARASVSDSRNSALLVLAAGTELPPDWLGKEGERSVEKRLEAALARHARADRPDVDVEDLLALRAARDAAGPALRDARALADLPDGRYRIAWTRDGFCTLLSHIQVLKHVATALACDALLRARDGDADGSLVASRALVNTGRSLGDEPVCISQSGCLSARTRAGKWNTPWRSANLRTATSSCYSASSTTRRPNRSSGGESAVSAARWTGSSRTWIRASSRPGRLAT